jgi:protein TonB
MRRILILAAFMTICVGARAQNPSPPPLLARPQERPTHTVTLTGDEVWNVAIAHPRPEYPSEARRRHLTGKGFFHGYVSLGTGEVTSVEILKSTGHRILDDAVVDGLKKWKFRPHTIVGFKVPIAFTISSKR